ncbi:MAG TPA: gamma-glutamyltransferase [Thermomicrobiales bacterium]|nr:gamma-glutamyltransferase [Thermomicrobiales bacterium]
MSRFVTSEWLMDKTGASSDGGMVVAKQEIAAMAGAQVLAEGGNAVDAAVTTAWVMNVMEPYNCTIAGAGYLVYRAASGESWVVDFSNRAPSRATPEALASRTTVAFAGPLAAAVPATVAGLATALERFGTISLARSLAPAIEVAAEGMPLNWLLTLRLVQELPGIRANPKTAEIFLTNGDPGMAHGETVLRQTDLARTLRAIADDGIGAFYEGEIASKIVAFVNDQGGILDAADFVRFQPTVVEPLRASYRDYTLLGVPLPSPGLTTIQCLRMLAGDDLDAMGHNSADALHLLAEAFRLAFADRDAYLGDPEFSDPPVEALLSDDYISRRRAEIDSRRAMEVVRPGDVGRVPLGAEGGGGGTTQFCAVDAAGNMVSLTQTLIGGLTGLGVAGDTGVVMNCALQWFDPRPGAPNSVAPNKRPLSNMTPMIVERDGKPVLAVGAPGSRRITNAVTQVTLNVLEHGLSAQAAISAPRIDCSLGHILADDRIDAATIADLRERGHRVDIVNEFINSGGPSTGYRGNFSRPAAIHIDAEGIRHGGDYPFVEGMAVGVPRDA